nr:extracellular solute-binding protein [uncultured Oscillibacter sp.]
MKRRIWYAALMAAMILGLLSGCGSSSGGSDVVPGVEGKILNIYVWNDEFQGKFNANYPEIDHLSNDKSVTFLKDGTEIHWVINPTQDGVYQQKLDEALLKQDRVSADERVDMYLVEADYALKYIDPEANVAMPISQLGITDADIANQYRYTLDAMRTADGEIRGLSYQATPGMLVYRRSIAKAVLGTDDPETVAAAVSDWDKFYETAERMKDAGYYMYSGRADTYRVYSNNVSSPWVKNDKTVVVDPNMMRWVERSLEDTRSGINHNVPGQWIDEWNKDMGPDSKVFCFFLPAWGLDVCIKPNVTDTAAAQDWASCPSPQSFFWGGTWLVAAQGSDNPEHVKDIMLKMTADRDILRSLAVNNGEMSNDQPLMEELAQSPDFGIELLGGQNYLGVLSEVAANIDLSNISSYDQGCVEEFQNTFGDYFNGKISLEKAKANFEMSITERYPWLVGGGVEWP